MQALGTETTKALVLVSDVLKRYDPTAIRPYSIDDLWDHSRAAALLAGSIAQAEADRVQSADARLVGLLHDIGRLTLVSQRPEEYRHVFQLARDDHLTIVDAERRVFGSTHAEVGAYLSGTVGPAESRGGNGRLASHAERLPGGRVHPAHRDSRGGSDPGTG